MTRSQWILSLILALSFSSSALAAKQCSNIFEPFVMTTEIQKHITSTVTALAELRLNLDLAQAKGEMLTNFTALSVDYAKKENLFVDYLEGHGIMSRLELKEKIKLAIVDLQLQELNKSKIRDKEEESAEIIHRKRMVTLKNRGFTGARILLNKVEPGSFKMGDKEEEKKEVQITRPYELMATQTTQFIWQRIVELSATRFGNQFQQNANPSAFKEDFRPVESISFVEVERWIESLNKLSELGEPALGTLIQDFRKGDRFRLPTEAEWEFVVRARGKFNGYYHFGNSVEYLTEYAWTQQNSGEQTHPVAQKEPVWVDNEPFYDMHGNVSEFTADSWSDKIPGGVDPFFNQRKWDEIVLRGGGGHSAAQHSTSGNRSYFKTSRKSKFLGFRLVREVQK